MQREVQLTSYPAYRLLGPVFVNLLRPTGDGFGIEVAEHHMGVGGSGVAATTAVACGPRL